MLEHLQIKRARLSQISNRLLKNGILQVRQVGRSRKYSLTQAARAQLIAWGALEGGGVQ
jgi:DNA-binding MarR family transcriptional regulator